MSGDLSEVLGSAADAGERALNGLVPAAGVAGLRARVRRRRAVRHGIEAVAVLPVVAAVAVGGWLLLPDQAPAPPAVTPTPTSTPAPVVTPTPTPTPTDELTPDPTGAPVQAPDVVLGDPIIEAGMPPYHPIPAGLLEDTGPGWVLATYGPRGYDDVQGWFPPLAFESVLLVSPDGVTYEALRLETGAPTSPTTEARWTEHELLSWESGTPTAVVRETVHVLVSEWTEWPNWAGWTTVSEGVESTRVMTLDLRTGALTPGGSDPVERDQFGDAVFEMLSPDGVLLLKGGDVTVVATGELVGSFGGEIASGWCSPLAWWTADSILAECMNPAEDSYREEYRTYFASEPRLVTFDTDQLATGAGTVLRPIGDADVHPGLTHYVADGLVVAEGVVMPPGSADSETYPDWCSTGIYLIDADGFVRLPASDSLDVELNIFDAHVIGRTVYVESTGGCSGEARPSLLTAYDVDTGVTREIVGAPPRAGAAYYAWVQGLTSYVVGL